MCRCLPWVWSGSALPDVVWLSEWGWSCGHLVVVPPPRENAGRPVYQIGGTTCFSVRVPLTYGEPGIGIYAGATCGLCMAPNSFNGWGWIAGRPNGAQESLRRLDEQHSCRGDLQMQGCRQGFALVMTVDDVVETDLLGGMRLAVAKATDANRKRRN